MSGGAKLNVRVAEVVEVNDLITRFRFVAATAATCPPFPAVRIPWSRWTTTAPAV
jgi:hypothetical protein